MSDFFDNIENIEVEQKEENNESSSFFIIIKSVFDMANSYMFDMIERIAKKRIDAMAPECVNMTIADISTEGSDDEYRYWSTVLVKYNIFGEPQTIDDVIKIIYSTFWFMSLIVKNGTIHYCSNKIEISLGKLLNKNLRATSSVYTVFNYGRYYMSDEDMFPIQKFINNCCKFLLGYRKGYRETNERIFWKTTNFKLQTPYLFNILEYSYSWSCSDIVLSPQGYKQIGEGYVPTKGHTSPMYRLLTEHISENGFDRLMSGNFSRDVSVMWCAVPFVRRSCNKIYNNLFESKDDLRTPTATTIVSKLKSDDEHTKYCIENSGVCSTPIKLTYNEAEEVIAIKRNRNQITRSRKLKVKSKNSKSLWRTAEYLNRYRYTTKTIDVVANISEYYDYESKHIMMLIIRLFGNKDDVNHTIDELTQ